ncbi:MAG: outer membrane protein transport protein, partial [Vibrio sp.]
HLDQQSNIDFGFTYLMGKDVDVKEDSVGTVLTATTHADAILFGLQYSRTF